ncbi:hypothetical protein [Streptomyces canus]|uniref:hypothetical protein n=1 Tax=Streptomyces canus TaxID=58343 RepID=UPI002E33C5A2|nr:hypothetical protein [Streptomyces canus]
MDCTGERTAKISSAAADWVSHPRGDAPSVLVAADRFAAHLRELVSASRAEASVS